MATHLERGYRYAVCDKTYQIFKREPYADQFEFIEPHEDIPLEKAESFDCSTFPIRHAKETKGESYDKTTEASDCCSPGSSSCC